MPKIFLVIADSDEQYVESLVNFLSEQYSKLFQIASFTSKEHLEKYLSTITNKVDVLLMIKDMDLKPDLTKKVSITILFSIGKSSTVTNESLRINKFQNGDSIAKDILDFFSKNSEKEIFREAGDKNTKVIAIYSPIGGVGKTTISLALANKLSRQALSVFYLNLESMPTTEAFFKCNSHSNISNILYNIKEKNKNLALKIEMSRNVDSRTGIHYFAPADSVMELEEMTLDEIILLISTLKLMSQYDFVIVDMSTSLNKINVSILENSDGIYLLSSTDKNSALKCKQLEKELNIMNQRSGVDLKSKVNHVTNKDNSHLTNDLNSNVSKTQNRECKIPLFNVFENDEVIELVASYLDIDTLPI